MERKGAADFDQELLDLYDQYAHSGMGRREFMEKASKFAVGGVTAAALVDMLAPSYALARQIDPADPSIKTERTEYASPNGHGSIRGYLTRPAAASGKLPGVVVVHENRGLNPYIEDVARRLAVRTNRHQPELDGLLFACHDFGATLRVGQFRRDF